MNARGSDAQLEARQRNGASHRGRKRSAETRAKMAASRWRPSNKVRVPAAAKARAVALFLRGLTQREAAAAAGISLGALQRALKAAGR